MKKQDNQGFTLLEVLVAVFILAIVILPLLHSFVSSYRVNAKSRQTMRATTLAQNEMEIFEKEKLEALLDAAKFDYTVSGPDTNGCYAFKRSGIINGNLGNSMFDVVVTLNPEKETGSSRYHDQNTAEFLYMNTVSNLDGGSFVQSIRSPGNEVDYDRMVYGIFNTHKLPGGVGSGWGLDDFASELERRITIHISTLDDGGEQITKAKVTYSYTCGYGVMPAEYQTYTEEKIMFDNAQSVNGEGKRTELKSLYLFYAPRYDTAKTDVITIENEAKIPVNIYIIRQDIWKKDADEIQSVPAGYQAKIEIQEGMDADGKSYGRYFTNLNLGEAETEGRGKKVLFSLKDYDNPSRVFSETEIKDITGIRKLGYEEAKDRIFTMEVKVYEAGADTNSAEPIVKMTGSKLN